MANPVWGLQALPCTLEGLRTRPGMVTPGNSLASNTWVGGYVGSLKVTLQGGRKEVT